MELFYRIHWILKKYYFVLLFAVIVTDACDVCDVFTIHFRGRILGYILLLTFPRNIFIHYIYTGYLYWIYTGFITGFIHIYWIHWILRNSQGSIFLFCDVLLCTVIIYVIYYDVLWSVSDVLWSFFCDVLWSVIYIFCDARDLFYLCLQSIMKSF